MTEAFIIDAVRTPRGIGKAGKGALADLHPTHLARTVLEALRQRNNFDPATVDDVIWSVSAQRGPQGGDMGRMAVLAAGYGPSVSGVTLDRFCGGGITAVGLAAASIAAGQEDLLIAGGTEMMSLTATLAKAEAQAGFPPFTMGAGYDPLDAVYPQSHQGVCADAIAALDGITRHDLDAWAVQSQQRAARAIAEGRFDRALIPVYDQDGALALDRDEFVRPQTTLDSLAALRPSFESIATLDSGNGYSYLDQIKRVYPNVKYQALHHAGNSSGVVDGAAAVLLASAEAVERLGLQPRARVVATANMGGCPTLMLNAPVPAARKVLRRAGLAVEDIALWEINEAFAVVAEKFVRDLGLDRDRVNVNGGAIALGHPIGATGAMLIGTIVDELERSNGRYGLVTMCAAGGMAPAIIIENLAWRP